MANIAEMSLFKSCKLTTGEAFTEKEVLAVVKTDGLAYNAVANTANCKVVGVNFDAYASGAVGVFRKGTFRFTNSTANPIAAKDIGSLAEVETSKIVRVAGTSTWTTPVYAGTIIDVDSNGVMVDVGVINNVTVSAS